MAIVVQPAGMVQAFAALGQLVAKARANEEAAQRMERAADRAARLQSQLLAQRHQREMLKYRTELDLETQKEAERRARAWQIEKMEIASRLDFQREEQRYQRYQAEKEAKLEALDKAYKKGLISAEDYNSAVLQTTTEVPFYDVAHRGKATDPLRERLASMLGGSPTEGPPTIGKEGAAETISATGEERIRVRAPDGTVGTIDIKEWPKAKEQGFTFISANRQPENERQERYAAYAKAEREAGRFPLDYIQWIAEGEPEPKPKSKPTFSMPKKPWF